MAADDGADRRSDNDFGFEARFRQSSQNAYVRPAARRSSA
jgi:hypothetical protein